MTYHSQCQWFYLSLAGWQVLGEGVGLNPAVAVVAVVLVHDVGLEGADPGGDVIKFFFVFVTDAQ